MSLSASSRFVLITGCLLSCCSSAISQFDQKAFKEKLDGLGYGDIELGTDEEGKNFVGLCPLEVAAVLSSANEQFLSRTPDRYVENDEDCIPEEEDEEEQQQRRIMNTYGPSCRVCVK